MDQHTAGHVQHFRDGTRRLREASAEIVMYSESAMCVGLAARYSWSIARVRPLEQCDDSLPQANFRCEISMEVSIREDLPA